MSRLVRHPLVIAIGVVLIPFIVLAVRITRGHFIATSDIALIELRTRDVGTNATPLVGAYSRFVWNHPGPLLFYALAIPYRLFGSSSRAILLGGTALNAISIGAVAYLCWRRGRVAALLLGLVVSFVLANALGGSTLLFPWNPFVIVLPLLVLVFLTWSVACGDHWMLPFAMGVASFVMASHVGSAVPAFVLLAIALAYFVVDAVHGRVKQRGQVIAWAVGVAFFAWVPPIIEQFRPDGGNLGTLWDYFTGGHHSTVGLVDGARLFAPQLSIPAPWFTGHERLSSSTGALDDAWQVPIVLVVLIVATVVAGRRRDRDALSLDVIALALFGAGWIATANVVDEPFPYLLKWTWVVGAAAWFAIGWTAIRVARDHLSAPQRRGVLTAAAALVALFVTLTTISSVRAYFPDPRTEQLAQRLRVSTLAAGRDAPQPILLQGAGGLLAGAIEAWMLLQFDRAGIASGADPDFQYAVGARHVVGKGRERSTMIVAANEQIAQFANDPRYRSVAVSDELAPADRDFVTYVNAQIGTLEPFDRLAWPQQHPVEWERLASLSAHSDRVAIFLTPPPPAS